MKKTIILALILTGFLVFLSPNFSKVQAITLEELQAQIQQLLQIIQQLLAQRLQQSQGRYCFYNDLSYGMRSSEVQNLQIVLGVTPITGYFGDTTLAAVKKFQEEHNIKVTGEVGPQTRAVLNNLYCVPSVTTTVSLPQSQCGWCGQDCIRETPTMYYCPIVKPPLEVECKEVNGVCTVVPTTKYFCEAPSTAHPYPTCVLNQYGTFNSLAECQKVCRVSVTCTDSDGGKNIYVKGHTKGYEYGFEPLLKELDDRCGCLYKSCSKIGLWEYYCEDATTLKIERIECPSGFTCQDGACKQSANSTSYLDSLKTQLPQLSDLIKRLSATLIHSG